MVVTVTLQGYIKRTSLDSFRAQARGGKGRAGMTTKDEDAVTNLFVTSTHTTVLFFSNHGKVYRMKVWRLPEGGPASRGRPMVNLLPLANGKIIQRSEEHTSALQSLMRFSYAVSCLKKKTYKN